MQVGRWLRNGVLAAALGAFAAPAAAEEVLRLPVDTEGPSLLVRRASGRGPVVLLVHGATFPSGLSAAYRIDGRSWMDDLQERGFDVWAFDFPGFGGSAPWGEPVSGRPVGEPPGRAAAQVSQVERVALEALRRSGRTRLTVVAHSWGTIPGAMFAARRPDLVERLVLFGPIALRPGREEPPAGPSVLVSVEDQWRSFQAGVPAGEPSPIAPEVFRTWAGAYLALDPESGERRPPAVAAPAGPQLDLAEAWSGRLPYDPAAVRAPVAIVRGAWDEITGDEDAAWLVRAFAAAPEVTDWKLPAGGHRMHLEANRQMLFDLVAQLLAPSPSTSAR